MPAVTCPVCRAGNDFAEDAAPACRRCRADLALVVSAERTRAAHLDDARRDLAARKFPDAERSLEDAEAVRPGADLTKLRAVLALMVGDFPAALRERFRSHE